MGITLDEFRCLVAQELGVDVSRVTPDASFVEDLLADSIKLVEMMLRLEDVGVYIPLEAAWEVQTVGDAYRLYVEYAEGAARPAMVAPRLAAK